MGTTKGDDNYVHECQIRDLYAANLSALRPLELVSQREVRYSGSPVRADLRTLDMNNVVREWEFKISANYSAIGQVLTYTAQAKLEFGFERTVLGVIAAFIIPQEIRLAVTVGNLAIELVEIPSWMRHGGATPPREASQIVVIPQVLPPT